MRKISSYEKIIISFGVVIGVFFLVSLMKCVTYSIVLADRSMWNALSIYKMLGVEAAYIYTHCNDNFVSTLVFRLSGWVMCAIMSGILWVFRFVIPFCKWLRGRRSQRKAGKSKDKEKED